MWVHEPLSLIVVCMFVRSKRSCTGLKVQQLYIYINYMNVYLYLVIIVINVLLEENFH